MRFSSGDRLERLLAAIPWIVANDGPTIAEVSERFDYPLARLAEDLETVFLVGVPPYTPDSLITVIVEDDRVWISFADYFERPLRLTPDQALALVAAASSLLEFSLAEAGPLRRGLDKLASALGLDLSDSIEVHLGSAAPATIERLREAVAANQKVCLDYYTYGRDERAERVVQPHRVFAAEGEWYLTGHCESARAERVFRLDRIHGLETLNQGFERPESSGDVAIFRAQDEYPRVELVLAQAGRWVADAYPVESAEEVGDGRLRVSLAVSATPWLERLLLQLGPDAELVSTTGALSDRLAETAAERVLARYVRC
jgi:proteasome accessory factor C